MSDINTVWPDWELAELIGTGGWSRVYRAVRKDQKDIQAAVKVLNVPAEEADSVLDEIRRLKRFEGTSHVVSIEDYAVLPEEDGTRVILIRMELLTPLRSYLSDRTLSESEVLRMGIELCRGLSLCHGNGLLHGDIKPDNILVKDTLSSGVLFKLGDFGISGILGYAGTDEEADPVTGNSEAKGTPEYMAPELMEGRQDGRSDLYSLGITMYRYLNGDRLPFLSPQQRIPSHENRLAALRIRLSGTPLPPASGASPETMSLLWKACAWNPEERFPSADAFREEMERVLRFLKEDSGAREKPAKPDRNGSKGKAAARLRRLMFLVLIAGVLAAIVAAVRQETSGSLSGSVATPPPLQEVVIRNSSHIRSELTALWKYWNEMPKDTLPEDLHQIPFVMDADKYAPNISLTEEDGRINVMIDPEPDTWFVSVMDEKAGTRNCTRDDAKGYWSFAADPGWMESEMILSRDADQAVVQYCFRCSDGEPDSVIIQIVPYGCRPPFQIYGFPKQDHSQFRWKLEMVTEYGVVLEGLYSEEGKQLNRKEIPKG